MGGQDALHSNKEPLEPNLERTPEFTALMQRTIKISEPPPMWFEAVNFSPSCLLNINRDEVHPEPILERFTQINISQARQPIHRLILVLVAARQRVFQGDNKLVSSAWRRAWTT